MRRHRVLRRHGPRGSTAVGDLATKNLDDLGHVVLYVDQPDQKLLPGAVHASGDMPDPKAGDVIEFRSSS